MSSEAKEQLGVCDKEFPIYHREPHVCAFGIRDEPLCVNWRLVEASAAPTSTSIEEAVRIVDRMTCERCSDNLPVYLQTVEGKHIPRHASMNGDMYAFPCHGKGRAIVDALIEKGLVKDATSK